METSNNTPKPIKVIKNAHTKVQLDKMSNRFTNHKGSFLNIQQILEKEEMKQSVEA